MLGRLLPTLAVLAAFYSIACGVIVADGLRDRPRPADVGVVLGAEVGTDGAPTWRLAVRLDRALEAWRAGLVPVLFVSGGRDRSGWNEAPVMKRYLVARGVPDSCVVEDPDGRNTWLTARHASAWMQARGLHDALVISQYFHLVRCRLAFARHGIPRIFTACPHRFELRDLYATAREVPALVKYALRRDY